MCYFCLAGPSNLFDFVHSVVVHSTSVGQTLNLAASLSLPFPLASNPLLLPTPPSASNFQLVDLRHYPPWRLFLETSKDKRSQGPRQSQITLTLTLSHNYRFSRGQLF